MKPLRMLLPVLTTLAALVLIVVLVLPLALEWSGERWLRTHGAEDAEIAEVGVDLLRGRLWLRGLDGGSASKDERLRVDRLDVDIDLAALPERRVLVERFALSGVRLDVRRDPEGDVHIGPVTIAMGTAATSSPTTREKPAAPAWGFGSQRIAVDDVEARLRAAGHDVELRVPQVLVGPHASWMPAESARTRATLLVDGTELELDLHARPWHDMPGIEGRLRVASLSLSRLADRVPQIGEIALDDGLADLDAELRGHFAEDGSMEIDTDGWLRLRDLDMTVPFEQTGRARLRVHDAVLSLDAVVEGGAGAAPWHYDVDADLASTGIRAGLPDAGLSVLRADAVRLEGVQASASGALSFARLGIDALRLLAPLGAADGAEAPLLSTAEVLVESLDAGRAPDLDIERIALKDPRLRMSREADGSVPALERIAALVPESDEGAEAISDAPSERADGAALEDASPLAVRLGALEIEGDQWFAFEDRALSPSRRFEFDRLEVEVRDIDTRAGAFPLRIFTRDRAGAEFELTGDASLEGAPSLDGELRIDQLYLTTLSPYLPGFDIDRGRFHSDSRVSLAGMELDLRNDLSIEGLRLVRASGGEASLLDRGMALPFDAALDLLRDRQDRIRFELPVSGRLDAPEFDTGGVVRLALRKAVQKAAFSYVKSALQPLGALLMVGDLAARATRPRFEPVSLEPGSSSPEGTSREYLEHIRSLLVERPRLQLTVCGVATEADRAVLAERARAAVTPAEAQSASSTAEASPVSQAVQIGDDALFDLAELRTIRALDFLSDPLTVGRDRLYACRARIETGDEDVDPAITVSL